MYIVMHDQDRGIAVLVDPAGPHALGPAIGGEGADQVLEAFVEGLDQDPTELTAFELAAMWAQFLAVMGYSEDSDPTAAPASAGGPPMGPGDPTDGLAPAAAEQAGEGTAVLEAGRDEPPTDTAPSVFVPCPNCGATKREISPAGAITCAVCGDPLDND